MVVAENIGDSAAADQRAQRARAAGLAGGCDHDIVNVAAGRAHLHRRCLQLCIVIRVDHIQRDRGSFGGVGLQRGLQREIVGRRKGRRRGIQTAGGNGAGRRASARGSIDGPGDGRGCAVEGRIELLRSADVHVL